MEEKNIETAPAVKTTSNFGMILVLMVLVVLVNLGFELHLKYKLLKDDMTVVKQDDAPEYNFTYIKDDSCEECFDIELFAALVTESIPEAVITEKSIQYDSDEGQALIKEHGFKKIPTVMVEGDMEYNMELYGLLDQLGQIDATSFSLDVIRPPYRDLTDNRIVGQFELIYIDDPSCDDCYDVSLHKNALENLQVKTVNERILDYKSAEAQEVITKYAITKVPTIIMQGELDVFQGFNELWADVGTIEDDGTYVYRDMDYMGKYRDLKTGEVAGSDPVSPY